MTLTIILIIIDTYIENTLKCQIALQNRLILIYSRISELEPIRNEQ